MIGRGKVEKNIQEKTKTQKGGDTRGGRTENETLKCL